MPIYGNPQIIISHMALEKSQNQQALPCFVNDFTCSNPETDIKHVRSAETWHLYAKDLPILLGTTGYNIDI